MEGNFSELIGNKKVLYTIIAVLLIVVIILLILMMRKPTFEVTFDSNGGSEVLSVMVKKGNKVSKPEDPTKEGYVFAGWYYKDELYDFDKPVTKDITLKAEWAVQGNADIEGIEFTVKDLTLAVNETATLEVVGMFANSKLVWSSNDGNVVIVDQKGNATAKKVGTAVITVKTADGKYEATCTITVVEDNNEPKLTITGANQVTIGSTIKLKATITPSELANKKVVWSSSNKSIATVDQNGNVKGLKVGTVTITAKTEDGTLTATKTITVKNKATTPTATTVSVTGVSISGPTTVNVGSSITLTANVQPSNATNKNVTWSSSNPAVATVDSNGKVTGISDGTVTITVTTADGNKSATYTVTVKSTYAIVLTGYKNEFDTIYQYSASVTKNGSAFSDYSLINYNGRTAPFKQYIAVSFVNTSVTTAQITLNSGAVVSATVSYR